MGIGTSTSASTTAGGRVGATRDSAVENALTGAAVSSPLLFGDHVTPMQNRLWLSSIALGTFIGAGIGLFTTASPTRDERAGHGPAQLSPYVGVVAETVHPDGSRSPVTGAGFRGVW